jgi:hypothetical protein
MSVTSSILTFLDCATFNLQKLQIQDRSSKLTQESTGAI